MPGWSFKVKFALPSIKYSVLPLFVTEKFIPASAWDRSTSNPSIWVCKLLSAVERADVSAAMAAFTLLISSVNSSRLTAWCTITAPLVSNDENLNTLSVVLYHNLPGCEGLDRKLVFQF